MSTNIEKLKKSVRDTALTMSNAKMAPATWGNVSARDPETGYVVITPSGMKYSELQPDDMCVVDANGNKIEGKWKPSSETLMHCLFYRNKPDVFAIVHTHSLYATAFAIVGKPIPVVIATLASGVGGEVPVAPYHSSGNEGFGQVALDAIGDKTAVLLGNHGVVALGKTLDDAYTVAELVESAAKMYTIANSLGTPKCIDDEEVKRIRQKYLTKYGQK